MSHHCEVCGLPERPPVFEGSAGRIRYVCPNNGKSVFCLVCHVTIPHHIQVLAKQVPWCVDCDIPMKTAGSLK